MNACPICTRPVPQGCTTCGNSRCQEISYLRNMARNARGKNQKASWESAARQAEAQAAREVRS